MLPRMILPVTLCVAVGLLTGGPVQAQTGTSATSKVEATQSIVNSLTAQGYVGIRVSETWLGRLRIFASRDGLLREIILHPTSGEVLRDWTDIRSTVTADEAGDSASTAADLTHPGVGVSDPAEGLGISAASPMPPVADDGAPMAP